MKKLILVALLMSLALSALAQQRYEPTCEQRLAVVNTQRLQEQALTVEREAQMRAQVMRLEAEGVRLSTEVKEKAN